MEKDDNRGQKDAYVLSAVLILNTEWHKKLLKR